MPEQRFVRRDEVLWRDGGDLLVLARVDGHALTVTGPGGAVWAALDRPRTLVEVSAVLARAFEADPARVRDDLERLLTDLADQGFVRTVG